MARRPVAAALLPDDQADDERERRAALAAGDDQQDDDEQEQDDEQEDDGEGEDDESELEAGAEDDQGDDEPEQQPQRRQQRSRRQDDGGEDDRVSAAERRAIEAEARLNAVLEQQRARPEPTETPEQEAARLALMTPEQLIDYRVNKALSAHQKATQAAVLSASNAADKASFDNLVTQQPLLRKVAADVEKRHADFVRQGQYPTRETVLTYILGERALTAMRKAQPEIRERQRRVERQQVRPTNNRSDVQTQRRGGKTLEQRLENVAL